ncbi:MAG: hypothetical protein V1934_05585 [Methanobacteriota archaeon]
MIDPTNESKLDTLVMIKNEGDSTLNKILDVNKTLLGRASSFITLALGVIGFILALLSYILNDLIVPEDNSAIIKIYDNFALICAISIAFVLLSILLGLSLYLSPEKVMFSLGPNQIELYEKYKDKSKEELTNTLIRGNSLDIKICEFMNMKIARHILTMSTLIFCGIILFSYSFLPLMDPQDMIDNGDKYDFYLAQIGLLFCVSVAGVVSIWWKMHNKIKGKYKEVMEINNKYPHYDKADLDKIMEVRYGR